MGERECVFNGECREVIEATTRIKTLEADNANHYEWRKEVLTKLDKISEGISGLRGRMYAIFIGAAVLAWAYGHWFAP